MAEGVVGKDCFRRKWLEEPIYSGGNMTSVVLPARGNTELTTMECFVTICGATVNVCTPGGTVVASHRAPLPDDVVLNVTAITSLALPQRVLAEGDEASSTSTVALPPAPVPPGVPRGVFIAYSTRELQLTVLQLEAVVAAALPEHDAKQQAQQQEEQSPVQYRLRVLQSWTAGQHAIGCVRLFAGGAELVSGSTDGSIKAWDVFHHHLTHNLRAPNGNVISALEVSEQGFDVAHGGRQLLVCGNVEGFVTAFDFGAKKLIGAVRAHTTTIAAIAFCPASRAVFTFGCDRKFVVSTAGARELTATRSVVVKDLVSCAVFESASQVHLGTIDGVVSTFHVHAKDPVTVIRRSARPRAVDVENSDEELAIRCVALPLLQESGGLFAADAAFNVTTFEEFDDPVTLKGRWVPRRALVGFLDQVLDMLVIPAAPSSEGSAHRFRRVIATNSKDVRVYGERGCSSEVVLHGHEGMVLTLGISHDRGILATGSKDKTLRFWSTTSWRCIATAPDAHSDDVTTLSFTHRGDTGVNLCVSGSLDENLRAWDIGALVRDGAGGSTEELAVRPCTGVAQAHVGAVHCSCFSPNDLFLATGGKDKCVNVFNVKGKKLYKEAALKGHKRAINSVTFSPVDRLVASASNDGSIRLWSLVSFTCVKVLQADKQAVLHAAFFNRGTQMVSTTLEGLVRVWAVSTGEVVADVQAHSDKIWAISAVETEQEETFFFTGAADGSTAMIEDFTAENTQRLRDERRQTVEQQQQLANAVRAGEYAKAFGVALRLNHPRHLRQVISTWMAKDLGGCEATICSIIAGLPEHETLRLLEFTREWIANARHSGVAAVVVQGFLRGFHFTELTEMPAVQHILDALWSYARRHTHRIQQLQQSLYYCDFLCRSLDPALVTNVPPAAAAPKSEPPSAPVVEQKRPRRDDDDDDENNNDGGSAEVPPQLSARKEEKRCAAGAVASSAHV